MDPVYGSEFNFLKLNNLIAQHNKFAALGAFESFGDGYLMEHNRIYAQVRRAALSAGYRVSKERNESYEAFPLLQLESILRAKVLPYFNNVAPFAELNPVQLAALDWEDIDGNLKKNFVFHEGAHAVARDLAEKHLGPNVKPQSVELERQFVLRMLLEESCANTCELLGIVDLHDQIHRTFFALNSYMEAFENRTHLKNAVQEFGQEFVMKFMLLAYLQANFLRERIEDSEFNKMIRLCAGDAKFDAKKLKILRALAKTAFLLSERFRVQTTGFHVRLVGIKTPLKVLLDFDVLAQLKSAQGFMNAWAKLFSDDHNDRT